MPQRPKLVYFYPIYLMNVLKEAYVSLCRRFRLTIEKAQGELLQELISYIDCGGLFESVTFWCAITWCTSRSRRLVLIGDALGE